MGYRNKTNLEDVMLTAPQQATQWWSLIQWFSVYLTAVVDCAAVRRAYPRDRWRTWCKHKKCFPAKIGTPWSLESWPNAEIIRITNFTYHSFRTHWRDFASNARRIWKIYLFTHSRFHQPDLFWQFISPTREIMNYILFYGISVWRSTLNVSVTVRNQVFLLTTSCRDSAQSFNIP